MGDNEVFDPVQLSIAENEFLRAHLGEPTIVALQNVPAGVNAKAIRPLIERFNDLEQLKAHSGQEWVGFDAIKECISTYLDQYGRWAADSKRGAPRFPSMFSFDQKGRPHRGAPGSDAGQVNTYFTEGGERKKIAIKLIPDGTVAWTPAWTRADEPNPKYGLRVDSDNNRIECLVCGHTESYRPESRASYGAARARISKHLRSTKEEVEAHREAYSLEFGS